MRRRHLLAGGAALLAAPAIARASSEKLLKFVPLADLAVLDPIWTSAYVTRTHGMMVFDTLFGQDAQYRPQPQMAAGAAQDDGGRTWRITLRDGLKFHDGTPVLARDCVASIRRWGARDSFGQALLDATDQLDAPDDRTIRFRLARPFPLLTAALAKSGGPFCAIMPERLARTDPYRQVTEMVGSGPYRFDTAARVPGSLVVYQRFADYVPQPRGPASFTAGPKIAHFDRVEWHVIPDGATVAAALQNGEVDWWEQPLVDLLPTLRANSGVRVTVQEPTGYVGVMRPNCLYPPFDNEAIRHALLPAIDQAQFMAAAGGDDRKLWNTGIGMFCPGAPSASEVGMEGINGPHDLEQVKRDLVTAGYRGERVVVLGATDYPRVDALAQVGADLLKKVGLNVDFQDVDWGTTVQRRAKTDPPKEGGWNVFFTYIAGLDMFDPAVNSMIRGNGRRGWFGWPTMPRVEALRDAWLAAPDADSQNRLAARIQGACFNEAPVYPLGQLLQTTAYRADLVDLPMGFPLFWGVRRG